MKQTEARLMQECYLHIHNKYPSLRGLYFTLGNNSFSMGDGMKQKAMGRVPGVADACLLVPKGVATFIEFKTETGRQSTVQLDWARAITKVGYMYFIARSMDDFKAILAICLPHA